MGIGCKPCHEKTSVGCFVEAPEVAARPRLAFCLKIIIIPLFTIINIALSLTRSLTNLASLHVRDIFFLLSIAFSLAILAIIIGAN